MPEVIEITDKLIITPRTRDWCTLKYPGHPKGCPMYGKRPECPPDAPLVEDWINLSKPHWFVISEFDIKDHMRKMKNKHPNWTERQCRNPYYWQGSVRSKLRKECQLFCSNYEGTVSTLLPEAMGVYVFGSARKIGIEIRRIPMEIIYKIALIGYGKLQSKDTQKTLGEF